jgi:hypothetical protein
VCQRQNAKMSRATSSTTKASPRLLQRQISASPAPLTEFQRALLSLTDGVSADNQKNKSTALCSCHRTAASPRDLTPVLPSPAGNAGPVAPCASDDADMAAAARKFLDYSPPPALRLFHSHCSDQVARSPSGD